MWKQLIIENFPRLSRFPYQVIELGYTHGGTYPEREIYNWNKFEVCLRLYSQKPETDEYIRQVKYTVKYPHVVLKSPGVLHRYTVDSPREAIYFAYPPGMLKQLRECLPFPEHPIWEIELDDLGNRLITELQELMERSQDYGVPDRIDIVAFQLLQLLIFQRNYVVKNPDFYEAKIRSIVSYFELHFREFIDLPKLLKHYGMSRSTFLRQWERFFDRPPWQYILNLKLQAACRSLETNSQAKIRDISHSLNFQNPAYFCALFKHKFGMTPLQYARRYCKANLLDSE